MTHVLFFSVVFFGSTSAWAYIDPGTGMTFVSGLGAFIIGFFALMFGAMAVTFKKWVGALKRTFSSLVAKFKSSKSS